MTIPTKEESLKRMLDTHAEDMAALPPQIIVAVDEPEVSIAWCRDHECPSTLSCARYRPGIAGWFEFEREAGAEKCGFWMEMKPE